MNRSDVHYAAKEICTNMERRSQGSWKRFENAGRYLNGVTKGVLGDASVGHRRVEDRRSRRLGQGNRSSEDIDEWRGHDDQHIRGEALVGCTGDKCFERSSVKALHHDHGRIGGKSRHIELRTLWMQLMTNSRT